MQVSKLQFKINHLLGNSSTRIHHLGFANNCLIYVCGCYLVFYNPILDQQTAYIKHSHPRISCIAVYNDQYVAIGDEGKNPVTTVYSLRNLLEFEEPQVKIIWELKGHKHTIDYLTFSPNGKYLVSVSNRDGSMFIWQDGVRVSQNKLSKPINKVIFDEEGDLVTVGRGHFKVWKFESGEIIRKYEQDCWMIEGKVLGLGRKIGTKDLIDVVNYHDKILALTSDGLLCIIIKNEEKIQKWIDLMMENTTSLQVYQGLALCSGGNSIIKVISLEKLTLYAKFPKPPPHLKQNITQDQTIQYRDNENFPDCLGVRRLGKFIGTLYSNRTIFIWKLEGQVITAIRSIISHQKRISSVCLLQQIEGGDLLFFGSASEDNTVRIWHFYTKMYKGKQSIDIASIIGIKRNVYCRNLTRIIYNDSFSNPIYHMKMLGSKHIVCLSIQEVFLYSLQNFQLLSQLSLQNVAQVIDTFGDIIYIGFNTGLVSLFKIIEEEFIKMRDIQFPNIIQQIKIINEEMFIISCKTKINMYSLSKSEIIFQQKNISAWIFSSPNIIYSTQNLITIYNVLKKKNITMNIKHQIQQEQYPRFIRSNSWLIIIITNNNKFLIANLSATIFHSEILTETINDLVLTESGQVIFVTDHGTISIFNIITDSKYQKVESRVKQWFEQNDMSWMDGSVWKSQKVKSSNPKLLHSIEQAQSLRMSVNSISFGQNQIPNVNIPYRREDTNEMSVFNPSSIANQVNKIYQNMEGLQKNDSKRKQQISENIQLVQLHQSRPKRRIFELGLKKQKQQSPHLLIGNLVDSHYQNPDSNTHVQDNNEVNHSKVEQISFCDNVKGVNDEKILQDLLNSLNSQNYICHNQKVLKLIYKKLHNSFQNPKQIIPPIINQFQQFSKNYLDFLQKQLL